MWIGIAFALLLDMSTHTDAALFRTEADCLEATAKMEKAYAQIEQIAAYKIQCVNGETLTFRKPDPVKPTTPSKAPIAPQVDAKTWSAGGRG